MSFVQPSSGVAPRPAIILDMWADVVCPWCYLAKARLRAAIDAWERPHEVLVRHRAYELDPGMPRGTRVPALEHLRERFDGDAAAAAEVARRVTTVAARNGLRLDFTTAVTANSFDAHRLVALGRGLGGPALEDAVLERMFSAHFCEGLAIDDHEILLRCAAEAGLDERRVAAVLAGDTEADSVRADEEEARRLGVTAVPHVVANSRASVSGARPVDVFLDLFRAARMTG